MPLTLMTGIIALEKAFHRNRCDAFKNGYLHPKRLWSRNAKLRAIFWHQVEFIGSDIACVAYPWLQWLELLLLRKLFMRTDATHSKMAICIHTLRGSESHCWGLSFDLFAPGRLLYLRYRLRYSPPDFDDWNYCFGESVSWELTPLILKRQFASKPFTVQKAII